jgi:TolB-like protein
MKKTIIVFLISVLTAGTVFAQQLPLKDVIKQTARGLEETIPQRTVIAIINFSSPTRDFSEYVIEELTNELLEVGRLTLVDRRNINSIRDELNLSLSGDVSDESALSIGKMLGARFIISGTLTKMESYHRFRTRIVNVETGVIQRQFTFDLQNDEQVAFLLKIKRTTSNVRNNWISAEVTGGLDLTSYGLIGFGVRYEGMLGPYISLGTNVYLGFPLEPYVWEKQPETKIDNGNAFGIDVFFRCYPMGGKFYCGLGVGYYQSAKYCGETGSYQEYNYPYTSYPALKMIQLIGVAITGELGWKIDIGKEGGFYIEPGFLGTFIIGVGSKEDIYGESRAFNNSKSYYDGLSGHWRLYLGAGWAF